jgi:pyruvate formate lyase activating enzyme
MQLEAQTGLVFDVMRFSLHDGPGIRTTVFLKGCPLHCDWCHNPESQSPGPSLLFFEERCRGCGECAAVCPHGLTECEACGRCAEVCVAEARRLAGRTMSVAEVLAEVERDQVFYDESGGGVTLSGGEPLAQPLFAEALLAACRARRIHTALDTSGMAPAEELLRVAAQADLVLYDVKLVDDALHQRHTGASNRLILDNLRALAEAGRPVVVRYPLIPGVNDGGSALSSLADLLAAFGLHRLDLLPYHRNGTGKYRRLGLPGPPAEFPSLPVERVTAIAAALAGRGLDVGMGGGS